MKCQKPYSCIRCCEFPPFLSSIQNKNSATFLKCSKFFFLASLCMFLLLLLLLLLLFFLAFYHMKSPLESNSQEKCGSNAVCQDDDML